MYDALNVLMAMNIIAKDKKVIKWLGIPECYKQPTDKEEHDNADLLSQIKAEELRQHQLMESLQMLRGAINSKLEKVSWSSCTIHSHLIHSCYIACTHSQSCE